MEEDLEGYMNWLTHADDLEQVRMAESGGTSLKVDVGKHKGDPVVMGLLKSTMFPLQQVLEGKVGSSASCTNHLLANHKSIIKSKMGFSLHFSKKIVKRGKHIT